MTGNSPYSVTGPAPVPTTGPGKPRSSPVQTPALARHAASRGSLLKNVVYQTDDESCSSPKMATPMEMLCRDSQADDDRRTQDPIGTRSSMANNAHPSFSTDAGPNVKWRGAHHVCIRGIKIAGLSEVQSLMDARFKWDRKLLAQCAVYASDKQDALNLYLCFDGMDDAALAGDQLRTVVPGCESDFVPFHEYADAEARRSPGGVSFYDGQVIFTGTFVGKISQLGASDVSDQLINTIEGFGEVLVLAEIAQTSTSLEFRVEYNKISAARAAISKLRPETPFEENGWKIHTKEMLDRTKEKPSLPTSLPALRQQEAYLDGAITHSPSRRTAWSENIYGQLKIEEATQSQRFHQQFTPVGPYFRHFDGGFDGFPDHYGRFPQPYQQVGWYDSRSDIDLEDIRNGRDVRTTIMLRNIPNGWTYVDLKNRLDEFAHGRYNFSYLRIDFMRHTNVGYGFVNLVDAMDIVPIYENLYAQPWDCFRNPNRKCDMSYATIQSLECLIEKFRNSAVMAEFPDYIAKLWWTWADVNDFESNSQSSSHNSQQPAASYNGSANLITPSMVGTERPFPGPDNHSRFNRSNANAAQSELWAGTRGGRGGRGGYGFGFGGRRGGSSNWDRGTTRQMNEDFYRGPPMQGMPYGYPFYLPQQMMGLHFQQQNRSGYGNYGSNGNNRSNNQAGFHTNGHGGGNNYQHYRGAGDFNNRQNGGLHGRGGGGGGGFVSNDARNDTRIPRSFSFDNLQAAQNYQSSNRGGFHHRGGFNQRGGRIYT